MKKEKTLLNACLCFPVLGDRILLGLKKKNIGEGCWNGWGGGILRGESPLQAIIREVKEEAGVETQPKDYEKMAIMRFYNTKASGEFFVCTVHIFFLKMWMGDFQPGEEIADPTWFKKMELPFDRMMPADQCWLPIILFGRKIVGTARYGPHQKKLIGPVKIMPVDSFAKKQPRLP